MEGQTEIQIDASTIAKTREALHAAARKKSCAILNLNRFQSIVCIVTRPGKNLARSSNFSLATARSRLQD